MKKMKLVKWSIVLLALLLAAMAMVPMVSAVKIPQSDAIIDVDINTAASIALLNVKDTASLSPDFSSWNEATVTPSTTYYDLQGNKTAYAFDVNVNGQYAGYILVSATKDKSPVLELSRGELPNKIPEKKATADRLATAFAGKKRIVSASTTPIYLGGTFVYEKYETTDLTGQKQTDIYVDKYSDRIVDISNISSSIPISVDKNSDMKYRQQKNDDIGKQWELQTAALLEMGGHLRTSS
jgi:hypothetical protein